MLLLAELLTTRLEHLAHKHEWKFSNNIIVALFKLHVYILHNGNLTPRMELDHSGPITDCAFSPDNQYLAVADANRLVTLYGLPSYEVIT